MSEEAEVAPTIEVVRTKEELAVEVVKKYMTGNAALGLLPIPLFDQLAIWGVQMAMIRKISHIYGVQFRENAVKSVLSSYLGTVGAATIGFGFFRSALKLSPGAGIAIGALAQGASSGALTYALGKIYIMHFEAGGTLFDLNPSKMKAHFEQLYKEGLEVAKTSVAEAKAEAAKSKAEDAKAKADEAKAKADEAKAGKS